MGRLSLFAAAALAVTAGTAHQALAQVAPECIPPTVMVLFDRSTSMNQLIGSKSKWTIATSALKNIVGDYQFRADFGLTLFPKDDWSCAAGSVVVTPQPGALDDFTGDLATAPPKNYWTPIGRTVKAVTSMPGMLDAGKRRFVILVTDGKESCPENDYPGNEQSDGLLALSRNEIVSTVAALKMQGITTYVVGFGSSTAEFDPLALNQMAIAGGTALPGCVETPTPDKYCFFRAENDAQLSASLDQIMVGALGDEVCDNEDNDCDGKVDDFDGPCSSACGTGVHHCTAGQWGSCSAPQPQPEVCDGVDNDCDNEVDEGCQCRNGDTRPCGRNVGTCRPGVQRCVNGQWSSACEGEIGPQPETCDGLDTNCDGIGDGACECINGQTETCGGPNVGQCREGTRACRNGTWGDCVGAIGPQPEMCDGIDNDCDGVVDDPNRGNDDDVPHGLCRGDEVCQDGTCIQVPPSMRPDAGTSMLAGDASGCACTAGGASRGAPAAGGLILGLAFLGGLVARRARRTR